jgi:probable blue pigment (indigoidine) exporter
MRKDLALTILAPLLWGTTYWVTTQWLPPGRPWLSALARALPAGLVLLVLSRSLPPRLWLWRSLALGAVNFGLFFPLLFLAAYRLPGGVAATMGAIQPLLVLGLAWPALGQRPRAAQLGLGVLGILGIALLVVGPKAQLDGLGVAASLGASALMAAGTVLTRRWGAPGSQLAATSWQLLAGALILTPLWWALEGPPPALTPAEIGGLAFLSLVNTAFTYVLWFRGIQRLPTAAVTFLPLLSPVVATLIGFFALGQGFSPAQVAGVALVLTSVAGAQWLGSRPP